MVRVHFLPQPIVGTGMDTSTINAQIPVTTPKNVKVRLAPKQTGVTISEYNTAIVEVNRAINQWLYS